MKKSILILGFASALAFTSCGNRETDKEDDVKLEEESQNTNPDDSMFQTSGNKTSENAEDVAAINSAKKAVNDYFDALGRGDISEAYETMSTKSDRGTRAAFDEKNATIESVMVSFTEEPEVTMQGSKVTLPLRYSIKTKAGNTETYKGHAMISKTDEEGDYKIDGIKVSREEN